MAQSHKMLGFEGIVAKNYSSLYRPNDRGWVKVTNPGPLAARGSGSAAPELACVAWD